MRIFEERNKRKKEQIAQTEMQESETAEIEEVQENKEKKQKINALAQKVMIYAREQAMVSLRFLDRALFHMTMISSEEVQTFGVDGKHIYYNSEYVLQQYKSEPARVPRAFLHMILHCVFCHPFHTETMYATYWNIACDLAVEHVILKLKLPDMTLADDEKRVLKLKELERLVPAITAERVYRFLLDQTLEAQDYLNDRALFFQDEHAYWVPEENETKEQQLTASFSPAMMGQLGCHEADQGTEGDEMAERGFVGRPSDEWREMSQYTKVDLESFAKGKGEGTGAVLLNLDEVLREKYDFTSFLKKFAVMGEEVHLNEDEFDYIYYTYGMELYDNMPLIEPLEYRENKRIKDFVIAIDTSGSCQGSTVQKFLNKTYTILKNAESYFQTVNIHIIQCDAEVQSDVKITCEEEFEDYMQNMEIAGCGGTDFRPVFSYVDHLVKKHEFHELKGLIYFTDGRGTFPERRPDYETAFVFLEDGFKIPEIPAWATKLVLREDEI